MDKETAGNTREPGSSRGTSAVPACRIPLHVFGRSTSAWLFDGPTKAARCGLELVPTLAGLGIHVRVGVHIGECERRGDEWSGMAVHVGARIGAMAKGDEVLVSRTVRDLSAGSGLRFESLGAQHLKGLAEETEVFRVSKPVGVPF